MEALLYPDKDLNQVHRTSEIIEVNLSGLSIFFSNTLSRDHS